MLVTASKVCLSADMAPPPWLSEPRFGDYSPDTKARKRWERTAQRWEAQYQRALNLSPPSCNAYKGEICSSVPLLQPSTFRDCKNDFQHLTSKCSHVSKRAADRGVIPLSLVVETRDTSGAATELERLFPAGKRSDQLASASFHIPSTPSALSLALLHRAADAQRFPQQRIAAGPPTSSTAPLKLTAPPESCTHPYPPSLSPTPGTGRPSAGRRREPRRARRSRHYGATLRSAEAQRGGKRPAVSVRGAQSCSASALGELKSFFLSPPWRPR